MATAAQLGKHVSKQDLVAVLDLIETAQRVASEQQFHGLMHKLLGVLPIERADVCVAELSPGNAVSRNNRRLSLNYPAEWVQVYRSRGYYRVDPVARRLFVDRKPLIWSQLRRREQTPVEQAFYGTAAEF